jgi:hypothetical protein
MPPARKSVVPAEVPDVDHRRQQEEHRGAHQDRQVGAPAAARLVGAGVGDQRIGDQRQHFVEQEQRQQVGGEGDRQRGGDGQREADVEARLVLSPGCRACSRWNRPN